MLTVEETTVLDRARRAYAGLTYDDCSRAVLADVAQRHGVDFATALFFDRVRRAPRNRAFATALERAASPDDAVRGRGTLLIVPALFYRERPEIGGDGAVVREVAERAGLEVVLVPVTSGGSADENARLLCDLLPKHCSDPTVVVSLSKGSADVRLAFESMPAPPVGLRAWINVSGLLRGTPAIDRLMARWWRRWLLQMIIARAGGSAKLASEFITAATSRLNHPAVAPPGLLVINLPGFPLTSHLGTTFGRLRHRHMAAFGPNDGLGLFRDAIIEPGLTYPVWGADHYFRVPQVRNVLIRVITYLIRAGCLEPGPNGGGCVRSG